MCFFRTFLQLSVDGPTSDTLKDLHQCYNQVFPLYIDFRGLPMGMIIHTVAGQTQLRLPTLFYSLLDILFFCIWHAPAADKIIITQLG
jgi:hypothetical protein